MILSVLLRKLILVLLLLDVVALSAQEHPSLGNFAIASGFGTVELNWTMIAGNTCQGIDVLRATSADSTALVRIGGIDGLCGDISEPIDYHFTDASPPELTTIYYRLVLGTQGFSSIKRVENKQIISEESRFYPSPVSDRGTLLLRVPPRTLVDLRVFDGNGKVVIERYNVQGPAMQVDVTGLDAGTYFFDAVASDRTFSGKFIKTDQ